LKKPVPVDPEAEKPTVERPPVDLEAGRRASTGCRRSRSSKAGFGGSLDLEGSFVGFFFFFDSVFGWLVERVIKNSICF